MPLPDNHNHFIASADPQGMLDAAAAAGVTEIVFAEHVFHIQEVRAASAYLRDRWRPEGPPRSHAAYLDVIRRLDQSGPMPVRVGIELDAVTDHPQAAAVIDAYVARHAADWDVVLGSIHTITGDVAVGMPKAEPVTTPPDAAWRDYTQRMITAVESGSYDVITHPVRLALSFPDTEPPDILASLMDELAGSAAAAGVALEVNGADVVRSPRHARILIDAIARHRAPVSLGSDAHYPRSAGRIRHALPLLAEAGIDNVSAYRHRQPRLVALGTTPSEAPDSPPGPHNR